MPAQPPIRPRPTPEELFAGLDERVRAVLADDGPIGRALTRAKTVPGSELAKLVGEMQAELAWLRGEKCLGERNTYADMFWGDRTPMSNFMSHLREPVLNKDRRALFVRALVVAQISKDGLWSDKTPGGHLLANEPCVYESVFGNLIPQVHLDAAYACSFLEDLSPTADLDWRYYRRVRVVEGSPGIPTGFDPLDQLTGGLRGVALIGGPPGAGKSTFLTNVIFNVLGKPGVGVVYVTAEEDKLVFYRRFHARAAGLPVNVVAAADPGPAEKGRLDTAEAELVPRLKKLQVMSGVRFRRENVRTEDFFRKLVEPMIRSHGRVLVVVDSLTAMDMIVRRQDSDDDCILRSQPGDFATDVTKLRVIRSVVDAFNHHGETRVTAAVVVPVSPKDAGGADPGLGVVRGSSDLVFAADQVFLLARDGDPTPAEVTPVRVHVAKARGGAEGVVRLGHDFGRATFVVPAEAPAGGRRGQAGKAKRA